MKIRSLIFLYTILVCCACSNKEHKSLLPTVNGVQGEVMVVMNDESWKLSSGETLREILGSPVYGLPQDEPSFDVQHINFNAFGDIFKRFRNVILAEIGPKHSNKIIVQQNVWAQTQIVITIYASSDSSFVNLVKSNEAKIIDILNDYERKRVVEMYQSLEDKELMVKIRNKHKLIIKIPKGYNLDLDTSNFVWLSREYKDIIQGIFLYSYDNSENKSLTSELLIEKRNEFLKKYVGGEAEGSYMTTEPLYPPSFNEYNFEGGKYTAEIRGLWRMQNGLAMGGPFVSISRIDSIDNRIVTAEGFVFAPAHNKRNYIRQVEAIVYSLDIAGK